MLVAFIYKSIGILGGMGPEATSELYMRIVRFLQEKGAKYDADFPPIYVYSLPLPDVVENVESEDVVVSMLVGAVKKLENFGVSFIAIPCNSVFSYFEQMQNAVSVPIINIMDETAKKANEKRYKKVGLLGTKLTIKQKLFEKSLENYNIGVLNPTMMQQEDITKIIMNILSGKKLAEDKSKLKSIIKYLQGEGAEAVILGCTELPLILSQSDADIELLDTIGVIAKSALNRITK
ncbi:MAG: amino acid racemase [Nanoarchaeota archaeon]|nr:amino acid racemase [Nanoarchaeota archaeon]